MTPERKNAIQTGAAIGLGVFIWNVAQDLLLDPLGLPRTLAVFGGGAIAALAAGSLHWILGRIISAK